MSIDVSTAVAIVLGQLNTWIPILLESVKNPASKAKMKKYAKPLRIAANQILVVADQIDAA